VARPVKWRKIDNLPTVSRFIPSGGASDGGAENILKIEELEALRLKDLEGLEQEACALRMEVSRPTFQRILTAAREKVADSLIHGKALQIEGGHFTQNLCAVRCSMCGREWTEPFELMGCIPQGVVTCPDCGTSVAACRPEGGKRCCQRGQCKYHSGNSDM